MAVRPGRGRRGLRSAAAGGDGRADRPVRDRVARSPPNHPGPREAQPADVDGRYRRVVLGVPMAIVLTRQAFAGQRLVRSLVLLPLVLPRVVGGIALLYTFGRRGLLARPVAGALGGEDRLLHHGGGARADLGVCRFWWSALRAPCGRSRQRCEGSGRALGGRPSDGVAAGHAAAGVAGARVGGGAVVRPGARRVRRHAHVRRQPAGCDADIAAGDLPAAAGIRRRCRGRVVAGAGRSGDRGRRYAQG